MPNPSTRPSAGTGLRLREVLDVLEQWFEPSWAESWDAVGLVCGDPDEPVRTILLAVDAVPATVAEAQQLGAQLLLTHHPLLLDAVHGVPADDPKGALVHRMIRSSIAHYVAHTNADVAAPGVSDALAARLGVQHLRPLQPWPAPALDKLVVFVPAPDTTRVLDALAAAGAGHLGDYARCAWTSAGQGTFRPATGAHPSIGSVGEIAVVTETRIEMVVPRRLRAQVLQALHHHHPYEQPAFDLVPMADGPGPGGLGRIGELARPTTLAQFLNSAARLLPPTAGGLRATGAGDQPIATVAVCGGSGASLIETARAAGADVFLTADLKHHNALDASTGFGSALALVDAAHWATEAPWLDELSARLRGHFGTTVNVNVSRQVTDPWTLHAPSMESSPNRQ